MQNILVTGANGFVGAALCERLGRDAIPFLAAVRQAGAPHQFQCGDLDGATALLGKSSQAERLLGSLQVDLGRTRRVLGWRPPVAMRQALAQTAADFLKRQALLTT
jgi:nucleoside-diphosphate-sugar epimerase